MIYHGKIQGGQTIYTSILESEVHLLVTTVKVKIHQKVTYEGNLMINSLNEVWRDDKVYNHTEVKREGNDYKIYKPNELTSLSRGISFSSIRLYFQKPQSLKEIFFEADAVFKSIVPSENNDYWAIEHGKYLNNYHYNNEGKMEKAVIDSGFYNVTLLLRK